MSYHTFTVSFRGGRGRLRTIRVKASTAINARKSVTSLGYPVEGVTFFN